MTKVEKLPRKDQNNFLAFVFGEEKRLNKLVTARNTTLEYQAVANGNQPVAPLVQNTITITDAAGAKVFVNGTQLNSEEDKTDDTRQEAATGSRVEETPSGGDQ